MTSKHARVLASHASSNPIEHANQHKTASIRKLDRKFLAVLASCASVLATAATIHAAFPGRNGLIAFQSRTSDGLQIFTVRPSGHDLRQVTFLSGDAVAADWSPDGRLIVFEHDPPGECANVAIMNADGSGLIEFGEPTVCQFDPSFTPDGSRIVFDRFDPATNDEAHWSMDLNGNDRYRIGTCCADPTVSPDGRLLSFVSFNGQPIGAALFTSRLDGTHLFQVTPFDFDVAVKQDWSPDGTHLVFTQYGDEPIPGVSANIATIRPDGTGLRLLTHYQGGDVRAVAGSYSPDGRWIVFRLGDHGLAGLFKMRPDGSDVTTILPFSTFRPGFIDWGARPSDEDDEDDDSQ
jgi:Tol biopolymer transport system component